MGGPIDGHRIQLPLPEIVDGMVVGDLKDPAAEFISGFITADGVKSPDERLLGQVLCQGPIPNHAVHEREEGPFIPAQELVHEAPTLPYP